MATSLALSMQDGAVRMPATFKLQPEDRASIFFPQVSAYSLGASYISDLLFNLVFGTRRHSHLALVVKNSPAKVGNVRDVGLIPVRKMPWRRA